MSYVIWTITLAALALSIVNFRNGRRGNAHETRTRLRARRNPRG